MNTTPNNEAAYDRELIARMLDVCGHPMFTLDAYREQARLLRAADNASASAETVSRKPADAEVRAPSYDALLLIAQSVCGALERAGVTDCDDPGEAIDVLREQYEAKIAALSQQPEARGVVDGFPERYGCNGPQGTFWTDDAELANKLIAATFDRDDWTVTDTHEPGNSDAATRVVSAQLMHWHGLPVYVTGTVVSHPSNWKLIDGERNG